jgi:hypothetical protein
MTCGHIFRESKGEGEITVDLFYPQPHTVTGTLISYDDLRDIGLVSIETEHALKTIPIAPENYRVQPNSKVITVGCNSGNDPTVCNSHVKSINRYNGPPNIQVAGAPVDGRSGGGLISSEGFLVGVCNAADPEDDEGIYAALGTLHWQLAQVGLSSLYQRQQPAESPATEALADSSTATISLTDAHDEIPEMPARRVADSRVAQHNAGGVPRSLANSLPMNDASDAEIICIVRSKSHPERKNQIFVLDNVSSEFMQQVAASSHDPTVRADLQLQADRRAADAYVAPRTGDPVVRGQSYERR